MVLDADITAFVVVMFASLCAIQTGPKTGLF